MDEIKKQNNINHKKTFAAGIILLVMAFIYLLCFAFVLYVFITSELRPPFHPILCCVVAGYILYNEVEKRLYITLSILKKLK